MMETKYAAASVDDMMEGFGDKEDRSVNVNSGEEKKEVGQQTAKGPRRGVFDGITNRPEYGTCCPRIGMPSSGVCPVRREKDHDSQDYKRQMDDCTFNPQIRATSKKISIRRGMSKEDKASGYAKD